MMQKIGVVIGWILCLILVVVLFFRMEREVKRLFDRSMLPQGDWQQILYHQTQLREQNKVLSLKIDRVMELYPGLESKIAQMGVEQKRIKQLSQAVAVTSARLESAIDTVGRFRFDDGYLKVEGRVDSNTLQADVVYTDTMIQLVYKGARKYPKWWIFSPRQLEQRITFMNPNTRIRYSRVIKVE